LHATVRARVPVWTEDREMAPDLAAAEALLGAGVEEHIEGLE
jgi:histidine ammonia-lyase